MKTQNLKNKIISLVLTELSESDAVIFLNLFELHVCFNLWQNDSSVLLCVAGYVRSGTRPKERVAILSSTVFKPRYLTVELVRSYHACWCSNEWYCNAYAMCAFTEHKAKSGLTVAVFPNTALAGTPCRVSTLSSVIAYL